MGAVLRALLLCALLLFAGQAQAAWSLVAHTQATSFATPVTTGTIDTTGADLIVVSTNVDTGDCLGNFSISDNKSNTWTQVASNHSVSLITVMWYSHNPTVGAGHTFSVACNAALAGVITIQAWSGSVVGTVSDQANSATTAGATSLNTGSITPSQNNSLIVSACGVNGGTNTCSVNSGLTISDGIAFSGGVHYGGALAYLVQSPAAAINPLWSWAASNDADVVIADFNPAVAVGGPPMRTLMGVGQ
jgi:hypothetical protein